MSKPHSFPMPIFARAYSDKDDDEDRDKLPLYIDGSEFFASPNQNIPHQLYNISH